MNIDFEKYNLPKWPQLMIVGDDVTIEQAKDIILKTDDFLTSSSDYAGGNNHTFNEEYRKVSGLNSLSDKWDLQSALRKEIGCLNLGYVSSNYASSSFIYGPHGFCSPQGKIYFKYNVGKWPSVEDIYNDFVTIAEAFPYLKFKATLYNAERCEESQYVVSFAVSDGKVNVLDVDFKLKEVYDTETHLGYALIAHRLMDNSSEIGLPYQWYEEYADIVREKIAKIIELYANKETHAQICDECKV